jgi:trehalose 6-phosphate synthase/phosphatase
MSRLLVVTNRLPIRISEKRQNLEFTKSAGGLATGMDSLDIDSEKHWIGWPGSINKSPETQKKIKALLTKDRIHPVFLTQEDFTLYYEGYCNSTLWPLFHYFLVYTEHQLEFWEAYKRVNKMFLDKVLEVAREDDIIWVHDYQLMLLPRMIREKLPKAKIGFFLHIPFPSYELFRTLENRGEILNGVLGADLVGFHTYDYMRHFLSASYRILGMETSNNEYYINDRIVSIDAYPMGINYEKYHEFPATRRGKNLIEKYGTIYAKRKLILSVDRLDYTKGILNRLEAFELFLADNPEWRSKVSLYMIIVPSRDTVKKYRELKIKVDETIGKINGKFSHLGWIPIHYFYKTFKSGDLISLYHISEVALVTPLRDGMNLVAKEYVASKTDQPGVLILSEMAGASDELSESILINPNNIIEIADAIKTALTMPEEEQLSRLRYMQGVIKKQNVKAWANSFINEINKVHDKRINLIESYITASNIKEIENAFIKAQIRIFLLDYDGTLVPFHKNPDKAIPEERMLQVFNKILSLKNTRIAVISGRSRSFLDKIFGNMNVMLIAEHGAYKKMKGEWEQAYALDNHWKEEILKLMNDITHRTPGAFIEEKEYSIAWHYRKTDKWLAELRVGQLINALISPCTRNNLHLMRGEKIIEVKHSIFTKGTAAKMVLDTGNYDFIFAAGDDTTDLDLLEALPENAFKIKVGIPSEKARFNVASYKNILKILQKIAS